MRLYPLVCLLSFSLSLSSFGQDGETGLLRQLDGALKMRHEFEQQKNSRVDELQSKSRQADFPEKFTVTKAIYNEYKSYIYDSAFHYARRLLDFAKTLGDPAKVSEAQIKLSFVLISSGLFHEAIDTLEGVDTRPLADSLKAEYYYLLARTHYDLADFSRDAFYGNQYAAEANRYIDSALVYVRPPDHRYFLFKGLKSLHLAAIDSARIAFERLVSDSSIAEHEFAIAASTLSFIYEVSGEAGKAKEMLLRAAIADTRASTKETLATMRLAEMFFKDGDYERAYQFIRIAQDDADFYGARQRKVQVSAIYPIIEGKYLDIIQANRRRLLIYSSLITLLALSVIGFSIVIVGQNSKLQKARQIIAEANELLVRANHELQDANKIKEEYIWYYFINIADHIAKLDALKKSLEMKLLTHNTEKLKEIVASSIDIRREREELYHNFDKVFIKLFPNFVSEFNSFFKEEDRIVLKEGQLLNTELRIFALIRMGVNDHEKIAKILDYSLTTIYTYKARIRNKSFLSNEEFDRRLMSIRAI